MTSPEFLVDQVEAAELMGVSPSLLRDWRFKGAGPQYIRLGHRTVRYKRSDLERFIATRKVDPSKGRQR